LDTRGIQGDLLACEAGLYMNFGRKFIKRVYIAIQILAAMAQ